MNPFAYTAMTVPRTRGRRLLETFSPAENNRSDVPKYTSRFLQNANDLNDLTIPFDSNKQRGLNKASIDESVESPFTNEVTPRPASLFPPSTLPRPLDLSYMTQDLSLPFNRNKNDCDNFMFEKETKDADDLSFCGSLGRDRKWQELKSSPKEGLEWNMSDANKSNLISENSFSHRQGCNALDFKTSNECDSIKPSQDGITRDLNDSICNASDLLNTRQVEVPTDPILNRNAESSLRYTNGKEEECYSHNMPMALYSGKPLNPLSHDYLDQLDAHLMNAFESGLYARDQRTQTFFDDFGTKDRRKPHKRSSSLDNVKRENSNCNRKFRSLSVPRRQVKKFSSGTFPEVGNPIRKQSAQSKKKDHWQPQLAPAANGRGLPTKTKKLPKKQGASTNQKTASKYVPTKIDHIHLDKTSLLDDKQQKSLKDLLHGMTKDEGLILMNTVSAILKSRQVKKNVVFNDQLDVFPAAACEVNKHVNIDQRGRKSRDDKLCESFIQTYCYHGGQTASASSSGTTQSVDSENPTVCSDMTSPLSSPAAKSCDQDCNICHLIGDDDEFFETRSKTDEIKTRLRMKSASPEKSKRKSKLNNTTSKGFKLKQAKNSAIPYDANPTNRCNRPYLHPGRSRGNESLEKPQRRAKAGARQALVDKWQRDERFAEKGADRRNRSSSGDKAKKENSKSNKGVKRCVRIRSAPEKKAGKAPFKITRQRDSQNNHNSSSAERQRSQVRIKTPTPSPPSVHSCLPIEPSPSARPSEVESMRDHSNSCHSCTSPENCRSEQNTKIDKDDIGDNVDKKNVSFDLTTCQSETSLSQKIAELNLSRDRECDVEEKTSTPRKPEAVKEKLENGILKGTEHKVSHPPSIVEHEKLDQDILHQINWTTQNLLQKADDQMKKVEKYLDTISGIPDVPLPHEITFKTRPNIYQTRDWTYPSYIPSFNLQNKTPYTSNILHKMPPPPIKTSAGPHSTLTPPACRRRIHAFTVQNATNFNVNRRHDFLSNHTPHNSPRDPYSIHNNGRVLPTNTTLSLSQNASVEALRGATNAYSSLPFSMLDQQRLGNSCSSASLSTSSWDSPLLSLDSSGSYMEVTKLDETFTYDDEGNRRCMAEIRMTKSVFSNNKPQTPNPGGQMTGTTDSSKGTGSGDSNGTVPRPVVVKTYHAPESVLEKSRSSSHSPRLKTDPDSPKSTKRPGDGKPKTRFNSDPNAASQNHPSTPGIGSAKKAQPSTEDIRSEIPRQSPKVTADAKTNFFWSCRKQDDRMVVKRPKSTYQPAAINSKTFASSLNIPTQDTISTRAKAKRPSLLKRSKTLPPFRV